MTAAAAILVALGIVALIWGGMQKYKAGRLSKTPFVPTGKAASDPAAAGDKGAIAAEGTVQVQQVLRSPVTGTECLYYELEVIGSWKDGDSTKSKNYIEDKEAAAFMLDDGSGPVAIAAGEGGDFDGLAQTFDETKKEGFFADLKSAVGRGEPITFGQYSFHNPVNSHASQFQCVERVMPVAPRLFACGKLDQGRIGAPSWASMILSTKTRDELVGSTAKTAKAFLAGGAAAATVGGVLGLVATMI
jgi:E3 Ubiquitin ligase